jgi:hypothetical protein
MRPIYLHGRSNQKYELIAFGLIEKTMAPAVIYRSLETGLVFVRPHHEFFDGRFGLMDRPALTGKE